MPIDLIFSTLVFYALYRGQDAIGRTVGWHFLPEFPYRNQQSFGGFAGLLCCLLWVGRAHLARIFRELFSRQGATTEPLPYSVAILGAGVGLVLLAFFFIQIGMTIGVAVIFLAIYLMVAIVITRMRSEAGIFVHNFHYTSPVFFFTDAFGSGRLGKGNLVSFAMLCSFSHGFRAHLMPHQFES